MIEECCSYNDRFITMDPPEQLRLPMFIVGSMRASEFDVLVVDAGGQLPVSDALFFVAGDWLPAACRSLFPLVHQEGIASSASTRPQVVSPVFSLAKLQGDHDSSAESCMRMQNWKPYLQPFYATKVRTRINNDDDDYNQKNFSEEASKGCFAFSVSASDDENKTETKRHDNYQQVFVLSGCIMSDIVFGGRSDIWSTNLGCASVGTPDIRPPPQTISYTECGAEGRAHKRRFPKKLRSSERRSTV